MSSGEETKVSSSYLDENSFHLYCKNFIQHSGDIKDGWSWTEVKTGEEGYMKKTVLKPGKVSALHDDDEINALGGAEELDDDTAQTCTASESQVLLHYEFHVLYSFSHQVPVLYLRASSLGGRPLSLDEMWSNIHPNFRQKLLERPWDMLTQQEHPLLGQPFFMLHPCHTEEFMRPVLTMAHAKKRKVNYIATWLSVVGPVVGLDVPLTYHTALTLPD